LKSNSLAREKVFPINFLHFTVKDEMKNQLKLVQLKEINEE
jgi:hypothetical protein